MSIILKSINPLATLSSISKVLTESVSLVQVRNYAARKGTRERKSKKKIKAVIEKVGFIPHNLRNKEKMLAMRAKKKFDDSWKGIPLDNVYAAKYYQMKAYSFAEALQCHKETHHPDMYNKPEAPLHVVIELNMQGEKATRFVDNFTRIVGIPHKFEHGEDRSVIAFSKDAKSQEAAYKSGAQLAGGIDLIKQIQNGKVALQNFQFAVAHPDILPELVSLRGLMKRKFPNPKNGTLDPNLGDVVARYINGINYQALKDEYEKDFGLIDTIIGSVNMESQHLEANFAALINDVQLMKPRRAGTFISRVLLSSPPSPEKIKVNHELYLNVTKDSEDDVESDGELEKEQVVL